MSFPQSFVMLGDPPSMIVGTATYSVRRPRRPSGCRCGLPRSEYEGHNCPANSWRWTRWPS